MHLNTPVKSSRNWKSILAMLCLIGVIGANAVSIGIAGISLTKGSMGGLLPRMGQVAGQVIDARTGNPIEGALIRMGDITAATDKQGNFLIRGKYGYHEMVVAKEGWDTLRIEVFASPPFIVGEATGMETTSGEAEQKKFETFVLKEGKGIVYGGLSNTVSFQRESNLITVRRFALPSVLGVFAIPALIIVYKRGEGYRTAILFSALSALSGSSLYIQMGLGGVAAFLIIWDKKEYINLDWEKNFERTTLGNLFKYAMYGLFILFIVVTGVRTGMIYAAPFVLEPNTVPDLSGQPAIVDNLDWTSTISSWWIRMVYQSGDMSCHTIRHRSFLLNGNQMPICGRCSGRELGTIVGLIIMFFKRFKINWTLVIILVILVMFNAIDAVPQYMGLRESTNPMRFTAGFVGMGVITAFVIGMVLHEVRDPTWGLPLEDRFKKVSGAAQE